MSTDRPSDVHVRPVDDLRPHPESRGCWCVPDLKVVDGSTTVIVVHHALDGRALVEEHGLQ